MLAFVTTLRHPLNSNDYSHVEGLLRESVTSWLRQTDDRFVVVVVANRDPHLFTNPRVHFVPVDFDPPSLEHTAQTGIPAVLRDKGTKCAVGLTAARLLGASHVMFVDADDFVSQNVAGFVGSHPASAGWTITHGWRINVERRAVRFHDGDFDRQCGSSHIVRADLYPNPQLPLAASQQMLYEGYGDKLERWLGSHMHIGRELDLASLPFPGALYRVGTGQSHSGNSLNGFGRPISARLSEEFGVPATARTPRGLAKSFLPSSRAVAERLKRLRRR